MRYFKVTITYEIPSGEGEASQAEQILFCSSPQDFPKTDQLRELFYSLYENSRKYVTAHWRAIREEELPGDEVHLL